MSAEPDVETGYAEYFAEAVRIAPDGAEPRVWTVDDADHGHVLWAGRLVQRYPYRLMYVHGMGWHTYDGARWVADDAGDARRAVVDLLRAEYHKSYGDTDAQKSINRMQSASAISAVLDLARCMPPYNCTVDQLDADPYLLNTASGTLDLRTMTERPARPEDRITKVTRGCYRPGAADSGAWQTFLDRVLPLPEVQSFMRRYAGVALVGRTLEQLLLIMTGTGANGKGTYYKALTHALGDYADMADPDLFMHREGAHPVGQMALIGRRFIVVSESDKDRRFAEATMKKLVGGDPINARWMHQNPITFEPSHTAILVTNHLPRVSGDDPAVWRRLRVVPFDVVLPESEWDRHLDEKLQASADAILTWAVAGYAEYAAQGLAEPSAVQVATAAYQQDSDALARFVDEWCYVGHSYSAAVGDLYDKWTEWCVGDGTEPGSKRAFGISLDRRGYTAATSGSHHVARRREGIGLRTEPRDRHES
jgi:putative DNA primase/helicase